MRYFVSAADDATATDYEALLDDHGYTVLDEYDDDAIVLSVGGDGSILYNSRRYAEPTILPVAGRGSEANRIDVDERGLLDRLADLEDGREGLDYWVETHRKLVATRDGEAIGEGFTGLNDVHLHHANPVRAAKFAVRVLDRPNDGIEVETDGDGDSDDSDDALAAESRAANDADYERTVYEADRVIGDGLLVTTPFGSTGYYRSISGGVIHTGIAVAFNNVHKPADAPRSISLSPAGRVDLEVLTTTRSTSAVLARDDDTDVHRLTPGDPISVSLSDRAVEILRFDG